MKPLHVLLSSVFVATSLLAETDRSFGRFIDLFHNRTVDIYAKKWGFRIEPKQLEQLSLFIRSSLDSLGLLQHTLKEGGGIRKAISDISTQGEIGHLAKRELGEVLEMGKDSLGKAHFVTAINNFIYLANFYVHRSRATRFQGSLALVGKGTQQERIKFYPKRWAVPDIRALLLDSLPYAHPEKLLPYIRNRLVINHEVLGFMETIHPIMTPLHERLLALALRLHDISDRSEGSPRTSVTRHLQQTVHDFNQNGGDPFAPEFHKSFEKHFWHLRELLTTTTCQRFVDSLLQPLIQ